MNREEALNQLKAYCASVGIFGTDEMEKKIAEIADSIPPSTRADYNEDAVIAAAEYLPVYKGKAGGANVPAQAGTAKVPCVTPTEYSAPALPTDVINALEEIIAAPADKAKVTAQTKLAGILIKNPQLNTVLDPKLTVVPDIKKDAEETLKKYEEQLVQTDENKKNFEMVKDAVLNKKPLPVYFSGNFKPVGTIVETPDMSKGTGTNVKKVFTINGLLGFLSQAVYGRIPTGEVGVGCKLSSIKAKTKKGSVGSTQVAVLAPKFEGLKIAKEKDGFCVPINEAAMKGKTMETKKGRLPIAITFEIYDTDKPVNENGQYPKKKIRLRGDAQVPVWKRIRDYVPQFGEERVPGVIASQLSPDEMAAVEAQQRQIIMAMYHGDLGNARGFGEELAAKFAEIKSREKANLNKAANDFE